jgi:hypothetical protein
MAQVKCASCGAVNDTEQAGGYCEECGKRLPAGADAFRVDSRGRADDADRGAVTPDRLRDDPRRGAAWRDDDYPDVSRRGERSEEQKAAARNVAGTLFVLAAIQLVCGGAGLVMAGDKNPPTEVVVFMVGQMLAFTGIFAGLGVWALYMPVAAGIVGLIVYLGRSILFLVATLGQGGRPTGIIVNIIITVVLIQAISRAAKAK